VQNFAARQATQYLANQLNTTLSIDRVNIAFFDSVLLEGIYVEDQQQDTLLYARELRVDIGLFSLFNQQVQVDRVGLSNAVVNLVRAPGDTVFNYEFIPEAFASEEPTEPDTTASAWEFDLTQLDLQNVRLAYVDGLEGTDLRLAVQEFVVDVQTLGLADQHPRIEAIRVDGMNLAFVQSPAEADTLIQAAAEATEIEALQSDTVQTDLNPSGYQLDISEIAVANANIRYQVAGAPDTVSGLNYEDLDLRDFQLTINDIFVGENEFTAAVNRSGSPEKPGGLRQP
jgi:uncharacterized protein involved in outer membrane biogenesis